MLAAPGSASGGMTIALDALGAAYMRLAAARETDPVLLHRVAMIGSRRSTACLHNAAVVTLPAVCGTTIAKAISISS